MRARFVDGPIEGDEQEVVEPAPFRLSVLVPGPHQFFHAEEVLDVAPLNVTRYQLLGRPRAGLAYYGVVA